MAQYMLGIDLGTTATKAALYRLDGSLIAEGHTDVPISYPQACWVEQRSDDFYESAARAVRECLQAASINPKQIAGLAFDSQMAGIGSIDENFRPATRFDSWLDMRCQPYIDEMARKYGEKITAVTGCPPTCDHGPKILWWMHERPEQFRRIAKFVTPVCYVAGRMAGLRPEQAFVDYTFLHFTTVADTQASTWSSELCGLLGIDLTRLPRIVQPWEVIGEVQSEAARYFGLAEGVPIAAGCGDTAAGALGAGLVQAGMLLETAGTASVLACCTERFIPDVRNRALIVMRSVVPGLWNPLAYVAGGGLALRWFRDNFFCANGKGETAPTYEAIFTAISKASPGCDGLMFCPHLGGRVCPAAPEMRGAWIGFSWGHTPSHFLRAILESIGYEYSYYLQIFGGLHPEIKFTEARVIGGGSQSQVWNQMKADILGVPYRRVMRAESATWGSALIAGKATGLVSDLAATALATTPVSEEPLKPDPALRSTYLQGLERYLRWQRMLEVGFVSRV